jgi:hypothetical protein
MIAAYPVEQSLLSLLFMAFNIKKLVESYEGFFHVATKFPGNTN